MPDVKLIQLTPQGTDPRAFGVNTRADLEFTFNADGTFAQGPTFVTDTDRVVQDIVKGILTVRGSNYLAVWYGTHISELVNTRSLDEIQEELTIQFQELLGYLVQFTLEEVPAERVEELVHLKATENQGTINVELTVKTGGGQIASIFI